MCRTYLYVQNKLFNKSEQQAHEELIKLVRSKFVLAKLILESIFYRLEKVKWITMR